MKHVIRVLVTRDENGELYAWARDFLHDPDAGGRP